MLISQKHKLNPYISSYFGTKEKLFSVVIASTPNIFHWLKEGCNDTKQHCAGSQLRYQKNDSFAKKIKK